VDNSSNIAARAGRWSARHWRKATAIWLAFVAVAITLGQLAGTHKLSDSEQSTGESAKAQQMLASAGFSTPAAESVLVKSNTLTVGDPAFRSAVSSVTSTLHGMPQLRNLRTGAAGQISRDQHAQLIEFDMRGKADNADKRVQPLLDAVVGVQRSHPTFTMAEFGFASATHELNNTIQKDFQKADGGERSRWDPLTYQEC
jgi:RND superfamily putative drug exporter